LKRRLADLEMEFMLELVRERERERWCPGGLELCGGESPSFGNIGVPQRPQHMVVLAFDICADANSWRRLVEDMGSIVNWPLWIADSTDRRDSQLSEGAISNRTVGSL
jgi:hypothetical protein